MDFIDAAWEAVRVPHDWAIAGPFDPQEHGYAAKLPWRGEGWYRTTFDLAPTGDGTLSSCLRLTALHDLVPAA